MNTLRKQQKKDMYSTNRVQWPLQTSRTPNLHPWMLKQSLYMKEGLGEASYAQNSSLQVSLSLSLSLSLSSLSLSQCFLFSFPRHGVLEARSRRICSRLSTNQRNQKPRPLLTLEALLARTRCPWQEAIIDAISSTCREASEPQPEFMVSLNDLPTNDFNTIFATVPASSPAIAHQCSWLEFQGVSMGDYFQTVACTS